MNESEAFAHATGNLSGEQLRVQRRRAVFRWVRAGGVVIAYDAEPISNRVDVQEPAAFGLSDSVLEGAALQITTNLRAIGSACRRLTDYVVYLWNCELQAEYDLCVGRRHLVAAREGLVSRIGPACFAGRHPQAHMEIYRARAEQPVDECISARLVLPRGLCAFIDQRSDRNLSHARRGGPRSPTVSDADVMDAMLEVHG